MDYNPPGFSVHGSSRQESWSGLPFSSPGDLPDLGIEPRSPALQSDSLLSELPMCVCVCVLMLRSKPKHRIWRGGEFLDTRVAEGWTQLRDFTFTFHFHALEKEMATHSSVLAWRIPGTGEPGGLLSMGLHRVGHN